MSNNQKALSVYDAEAKELVSIEPETQLRAASQHRLVEASTLVKAVALARIADERLYLGLGCSSMKEYAEQMLADKYRNVLNYVKVGRKFGALLPSTEVQPVALLGNGEPSAEAEEQAQDASAWGGLGLRKLVALTRVEDASFEDLVGDDALTMPDGTAVSREELAAMNSKQVEELVRSHKLSKEAYQREIQRQKEKVKLAKSERKTAEEERKRAEAERDKARQKAESLEALFAKEHQGYEINEQRLEQAAKSLRDLRRYSMNCKLDEDSPEALLMMLQTLARDTDKFLHDLRAYFVSALLATDTTLHQVADVWTGDGQRKREVILKAGYMFQVTTDSEIDVVHRRTGETHGPFPNELAAVEAVYETL